MRRDWLNTRFGINFVGLGIVAICVAVPVIVFQDIWFVVTGEWPTVWLYDWVLFHLLAAGAIVFSAVNFFIFRPGLPKFVAVVLAICFASYVVQPLLPIHGRQQLTVLCIGRTVGFCTLLLLGRTYISDLKAGRG